MSEFKHKQTHPPSPQANEEAKREIAQGMSECGREELKKLEKEESEKKQEK